MSIFRLPPGPYLGGRQPYEGKDLNPAEEAVAVNDPPNRINPALLVAIAISWFPAPHGAQAAPKTPQEFVVERVPYVSKFVYSEIPYYHPVYPRKLNPSITAVAEDTVLKRREYNYNNCIIEPFHYQYYKKYIPEVFVETFVPFISKQRYYEESKSYRVEQKKLNPIYLGIPVLKPLDRLSTRINWLVTDETYELPRKLNPALIAVAEDTVLKLKDLTPVLIHWIPVEPTRTKKNYYPTQPEVVNDPPFGQRIWLSNVIDQNQLPGWNSQHRLLNPTTLDVAVNDPPFGQRLWLSTVLTQWIPLPGLPSHPIFNPPPSMNVIMWFWRRIG